MDDPRAVARWLEEHRSLPDAPDRERLRGYAVPAVPFRSGHVLAMRRFPATSVGPGYTSIWHIDPEGRFVIYQDQEPQYSCPRAFGPAVDEAPVVPIDIEWIASHRFVMRIDTERVRLRWDLRLSASTGTKLVNAAAGILPRSARLSDAFLAAAGAAAGPLLHTGRFRLHGTAPSGQDFHADIRRMWVIEASSANIDGVDLGEPGPLASQVHLRDFWLPQRGLFAVVDAYFESHDPQRHALVATRAELGSGRVF